MVNGKRYRYNAFQCKWTWDNDWNTIRKRNAYVREMLNEGIESRDAWREGFHRYPCQYLNPETGEPYETVEEKITFVYPPKQ